MGRLCPYFSGAAAANTVNGGRRRRGGTSFWDTESAPGPAESATTYRLLYVAKVK